MQRTDIQQSDVFISWTGKDRKLKNRIIDYLRQNNITCTESDHDCAGDFRQWSREAVEKSTIFLLLYTENTVSSELVPIEIEEFRKLDDYQNRFVPVVADFSLYEKNLPELAESESAVILNGYELSEEQLKKILYNVQTLINNRLCKVYQKATKPTYMRLVSMLEKSRMADSEFDHKRLYIERTLTDENGGEFACAAEFINTEDIIFLQGPAGSGKSCYIDQLRNSADEKTLVISLPCRKLVGATDLLYAMFEEFKRYCGNHQFYTLENFKSLLTSRHLLLVLDGMDEIATEKGTRKFLNIIKDYYVVNSDSTTLFFTSRNQSDSNLIAMNGQTSKKLKLCSLDEDQIKAFGSNLFLMFGSPEKSNDFYVRIQNLTDEIRTNPLLLSQLAIVYYKKNEIPQTTVGIYDAVCEITMSNEDDIADVPDDYRTMVTSRLSDILKLFSAERYRLLSLGKQIDTGKILTVILKNEYTDARERAAFLKEYLQNRAMLVDGEFYHKMLLEYFTATYYYEQCFDDYDEIENADNIKNLFEHYGNPYWSAVLQMFLVKADSLVDSKTATELYRELMTYGITEYTLLFDTCRDLIHYKEETQRVLIGDILQKSANGIYPSYGPLFWYVPEYKIYENLLITLDSVKESDFFTKALALTRDVCWIFGHYNTVDEITDRVNGKVLLEKASLSGVRQGLCELFFTGNTHSTLGDDIYPRCFNIEEAKSFMKNGCGIIGRMSMPFADELGLFSHNSYNKLNNEFIGLVSCPYIIDEIESTLSKNSCRKMNGVILSPSDTTKMKYIAFNRTHINVMYIPENICEFSLNDTCASLGWNEYMQLSLGVVMLFDGIFYVSTNCSLPYGIKEIPSKAFYCTALKSICIPSSVEKIGSEAFGKCISLRTITIPKSVKKIEKSAFGDCRSLGSVIISDGIVEIGDDAFKNCVSLSSIAIPDSVVEMGNSAFSGCTSLRSITLSDSLRALGWNTFAGCTSLSSIVIPEGIERLGQAVFLGCSSLSSITLPDGITRLYSGVFSGCNSLSSIKLPDSIEWFDQGVFEECSSLSSITLPNNLTGIDAYAFKGCCSLESISFPDILKQIGELVFYNCDMLKSINNCPTGYSQEYLGVSDDCVLNYRNNSELTTVIIPENVGEIFMGQFRQRYDIYRAIILSGVLRINNGAFEKCAVLTSVTLPDDLVLIGDNAFEGCRSLASVTLPDSLKIIGNSAFADCRSLVTVNIPDSVRFIGQSAFLNCCSLESVMFPDSSISIGKNAFYNCGMLKLINNCPVGYSSEDLGVSDDCVVIYQKKKLIRAMIPENADEVFACQFNGQNDIVQVEIPEGVSKIGYNAFKGCTSLVSATITSDVEVIESSAFEDCRSLLSIVLPDNISVIGDRIFKNCCSLSTVSIPDGVGMIGVESFWGCKSLVSVIIPESVIRIRYSAFCGCSSLIAITLPEKLSEIGPGVFSNCSSLSSVIFPKKLKTIGILAFLKCSSLKSIKLPDGVEEISAAAFSDCCSLESIEIPSSVRIIGDGAFKECTSLRKLTISYRFEDDLPRIFSGVDLSEVKINWV